MMRSESYSLYPRRADIVRIDVHMSRPNCYYEVEFTHKGRIRTTHRVTRAANLTAARRMAKDFIYFKQAV